MGRRDKVRGVLPRIVVVVDELAELLVAGGPEVGEQCSVPRKLDTCERE